MPPERSRRKSTGNDARHLPGPTLAKRRVGRRGGNARQAAAKRGGRCLR